MLIQIVAHTPYWVFALFALLVWLGTRQLASGSVSLTRATLLPVAMMALSGYGVISAFGESLPVLLGWASAEVAAVLLVTYRPLPAGTRYDAARRTFELRGSGVPLALMMGIFFTKYGVGVLIAMHPEMRHHAGFALGVGILYGAFGGAFLGRAVRLWSLAIRTGRSRMAGSTTQA